MLYGNQRARHTRTPLSKVAVRELPPTKEYKRQPDEAISRSPEFTLNKFYLDAVTDKGRYFIGYSADLSFNRLSLGYADILHSPEIHGLCPGPKIGYCRKPVWQNGEVNWQHPGLGFEGRWSPLAPSRKIELLSTPQGHVDWYCLQPAANVLLRTASGLTVEALGYCEHMSMTIPPWQLGLTELVWGRFVSASQSVVWIVWRGQYAMTLVLWNNNSTDCAEICEHHVNTDDFNLSFEPVRTLRQGYLGQNILSRVPVVNRIAPASLSAIYENKQLSRGVLQMSGGEQHKGWVIHEKVTWPR